MRQLSKYKKILFVVLLLLAVGLFGFDQYMKATWDHHHVETDIRWWAVLKNSDDKSPPSNEDARVSDDIHVLLSRAEAAAMMKKYNLPQKLEMKKTDGAYDIWLDGEREKLFKTEVRKAGTRDVHILQDGNIEIRIITGLYEWAGCDARNGLWDTGNLHIYKTLPNGDQIIGGVHMYYYENLVQYLFCYDMWDGPALFR